MSSASSKTRILLIEDDQDLATGLADALKIEGYSLTHAADGRRGHEEALRGSYDLVILDEMLPGLPGFELLRQLRAKGNRTPVIMLTARSQEVDKVRGLRLGADDYVTKPFGAMELLARIEAHLRRARLGPADPSRLEIGDVVVDFVARDARKGSDAICLTVRELDILGILSERRGEAVSRAALIARIWGTADDVDVSTRTVDQHVMMLRRKLGDDVEKPRIIETVYGFGYRLAR